MTLNKDQLTQDLLAMMKRGVDEKWSTEQSSKALAEAIDKFVKTGVVTGVTITVGNQKLIQDGEVSVQ